MSGEPEGRDAPPPEVTRFEVIDHRRGAPEVGRVFSAWNARVELSYQDGGRTLKVFVDGDATTENVPPTLLSDEERAERYAAIRADRLARGSSQAGSAPELDLEKFSAQYEVVGHICNGEKYRPYSYVLCSLCGPGRKIYEVVQARGAGSAGSPEPFVVRVRERLEELKQIALATGDFELISKLQIWAAGLDGACMAHRVVSEAAAGYDLSVPGFSEVNLARCTSPDGFGHALDSWSIAEWTNAAAGEMGEACNLAKKLLRHRDGVAGNKKPEDQNVESLRQRCAEELADVVIYADLAMRALGRDLNATVRAVFNRKSDELGAPYRVSEGPLGAASPSSGEPRIAERHPLYERALAVSAAAEYWLEHFRGPTGTFTGKMRTEEFIRAAGILARELLVGGSSGEPQ